ncbi:MAG: N-acetyltransferase [Wenzhouxiangellaceae bacterium]|nr:N-acetyltransferase [Wenzhouxiangellaceae bacterium]
MTGSKGIDIVPVKTRRQWNRFHGLPAELQRGRGRWIAPLRLQARQAWAPRNPFFRHARAQAWLALRDGRVVGRISAQIDALQRDQGRGGLGQFGSFEAIDDRQVAAALLDTAARWLAAAGMREMQGPFDLSINQQSGLLVDGFDQAPMLMMNYNPPYYADLLLDNDLVCCQHLLAYRGSTRIDLPARVQRLLERLGDRLRVDALTGHQLIGQRETLRAIFNAAWAANWGFVPLTEAEFSHMIDDMKPLLWLRPGYVLLARLDGEPAGFIVGLPDLNELIADLDGRLLWNGGAIRLLWRIARHRNTRLRVPLMGVLPRHHGSAAGALISYALIDRLSVASRRDGVTEAEQSWILADNRGMCSIIESLGMRVAQRFAIYSRPLPA